jgi:hypothetical protein
VYEFLANYQDRPNGGDGWLRTLEFQPGRGDAGLDRLAVQTYAPDPLGGPGRFERDAGSEFHYDLDFDNRFARAHGGP